MAYTVLKTGETETETGIFDCLTWIKRGNEEQQTKYGEKLEAIFEKAEKAIKANEDFVITDCTEACKHDAIKTVISTIEGLKAYREHLENYLNPIESAERKE